MTTLQKGILWMLGCLVFVFALSIGLGWYCFGYLDLGTAGAMGLMLCPVLGVAAWLVWKAGRRAEDNAPKAPLRDDVTAPMLEVSATDERG